MPADNFERPKPKDSGSNNYWGEPIASRYSKLLRKQPSPEGIEAGSNPTPGGGNLEGMAGQRRLIVLGELKPIMPHGS